MCQCFKLGNTFKRLYSFYLYSKYLKIKQSIFSINYNLYALLKSRFQYCINFSYSVDGGELFERVINDDFLLSEKACVMIIKQVLLAVEFIHSKNILHLDMKVKTHKSTIAIILLAQTTICMELLLSQQ